MIKLRLQYYILSSIKQNPIIYTFVKKRIYLHSHFLFMNKIEMGTLPKIYNIIQFSH